MKSAEKEPLLRVSSVSVTFPRGGDLPAVDSLSYTLGRGETLGVVGESGSGKSVSSLALMGLLPADARVSGQAIFDGMDLLSLTQKQLRKLRGNRIAMVFQDAMSALNPYLSVGEQIMEPLRLHLGQSRRQARQAAANLLEQCGIKDAANRLRQYPHEFSGGMRQRVMIAMALSAQPDVLIADEPTSALDVTVQADILALLERLQRERGFALLMISHDLDVVRRVADRVLVMQQGRLVEGGATGDVLNHPQEEYTRQLLAAVPTGPKPEGLRYRDQGNPSLLKAEGITVSFPLGRGRALAVENLNLQIRSGEVLGIVGESGSGKTSLLRALVRIQSIQSGQIYLNDTRMDTLTPRQMRPHRRRMQMVFQDPFASLDPRMTIHDVIAEPLNLHGLTTGKKKTSARVAELLQEVELPAEAADLYPHEFSGGQRQRIAIARALASEPELLLADEPVSALDVTVQANILKLLQRLVTDRGIAMLIVSHDLAVVRLIADRVMVMLQGKVVEKGFTEQIFQSPAMEYTRQLLAARP